MLPIETLNHPLTTELGWTLLHFLWQGTVVGFVVAIALFAMRNRSAAARYVVGIAGLLAMALCPLVTFAVLHEPAIEVVEVQPALADANTTVEATAVVFPADAEIVEAPASSTESPPAINEIVEPIEPPTLPTFFERLQATTPYITALWFVGAALLSIRLIFSWFQVQRLSRFGLSAPSEQVREIFERLCNQIGFRRVVRVFESSLATVPATVGWLRPIVLLPATAITGLSEEQLTAVLAHELAHVRRHDYAINLVQGVIETLLFYHPAVWFVSNRIRIERENCCDDAAVKLTNQPSIYAHALAKLAVSTADSKLVPAATNGDVSLRIRRVLGKRSRTPGNGKPRAAGVACLALLLTLGAGLRANNLMPKQDGEEDQQESAANEFRIPDPLPDAPTWVMAKHAIIFQGREVVTWEHVEAMAAAFRSATKDFYPTFRFTDGWFQEDPTLKPTEKFQQFRKKVNDSFGFTHIETLICDRRGFDTVRSQKDLQPDPARRVLGRVLTPDGEPAVSAQVVLLPQPKADERQQEVQVSGWALSNPLSENVVRTGRGGVVTVYPSPNDETVLILHRSGFLQTTTVRLREKKAIRLEKWATFEGSIDNSGLSEQLLILTTEIGDRLQLTNPGVYSHRLKLDRKRYPYVVVPNRPLRVERWIDKVGNIGAVPAGEWKPKSGETVEVNIGKVTEADIKTAQQLEAVRRRQMWFVQFEHESLDEYAKQLGHFKIELGAYFEDEGKLLYLSKASEPTPTVKTIKIKLDEVPNTDNKQRRTADAKLFAKVGVDVSNARLFYFYPGTQRPPVGILANIVKLAVDYRGVKWYRTRRTYFSVVDEPDGYSLKVTRQVLSEAAKPTKPAPTENDTPKEQQRVERSNTQSESPTPVGPLDALLDRLEKTPDDAPPGRPRWLVKFGNEESIDLYARQLDFFKIELAAWFEDKGEWVYLTNLGRAKPATRRVRKNLSDGDTRFDNWKPGDRHTADVAIFKKAGINASNAPIIHLYPKSTENQLIRAERAFAKVPRPQIKETYFKVTEDGDGFRLVVTRQVPRKVQEKPKPAPANPALQREILALKATLQQALQKYGARHSRVLDLQRRLDFIEDYIGKTAKQEKAEAEKHSQQLFEIQQRIAEAEEKYGPNHPKVRDLKQAAQLVKNRMADAKHVPPTWTIARRVIIRNETKIVQWDEVEKELKELFPRHGVLKATFRFTPGAKHKEKATRAKLRGLRKEVGKFFLISTTNAPPRFDEVRTDADLVPDPKLRVQGKVVGPGGTPASNAQIVILPYPGNPHLNLHGTKIRDEDLVGYDTQTTPRSGNFDIYLDKYDHIFIAHESGSLLITAREVRDQITVQLEPWAEISGQIAATEEYQQATSFWVTAKLRFQFRQLDSNRDKQGNYRQLLPPGKLTAIRTVTFEGSPESQGSLPLAHGMIKAGVRRQLHLGPLTESEAEQARLLSKELEILPTELPKEERNRLEELQILNWKEAASRWEDQVSPVNAAVHNTKTRRSEVAKEELRPNGPATKALFGASPKDARGQQSTGADEAAAAVLLSNTPTWTIARRAIISEDKQVVEWADVEKTLTQLVNRKKTVKVMLRFTPGGRQRRKQILDNLLALQERLGKNVSDNGTPFDQPPEPERLSINSRYDGLPRFDDVRTQADLVEGRKPRVRGQVVQPDGTPAVGADVLILPNRMNSLDVWLKGSTLHDRTKSTYDTTNAGKTGHFDISPEKYDLVFIAHASGTALLKATQVSKDLVVQLSPWVTVKGKIAKAEGYRQYVSLSTIAQNNVSFSWLERPNREQEYRALLPPGRVMASRQVGIPNRPAAMLSLGQWDLQAGDKKRLDLDPMTDSEREDAELQIRQAEALSGGDPLTPEEKRLILDRQAKITDTPTWIIARHAIISEGVKIVEWNHVETTINKLLADGAPKLEATLWFSAGAQSRWNGIRNAAGVLRKKHGRRLSLTLSGVGLGQHFDEIRTQQDLDPDQDNKITGQVVRADGKPAPNAQIITLTEGVHNPNVYLSGTKVRDRFDHPTIAADRTGRFTVFPAENQHVLFLHSTGIRLLNQAELLELKDKPIRLELWPQVKGKVPDENGQTIGFNVTTPGSFQFNIAPPIDPDKRTYEVLVPPGHVTVMRQIGGVGISGEQFDLEPGQAKSHSLPPMTVAIRNRFIRSGVPADQLKIGDVETPKVELTDKPMWIVAEHAIIFEGKVVVKMEHILQSLVKLSEREEPGKVSFRFTPGAQTKVMRQFQDDFFRELRLLRLPNTPAFSMGVNARATLDKVRTQADLAPDRSSRILGRILTPDGKPASKAELTEFPIPGTEGNERVRMSGTRVQNRKDYNITITKESGGYVIFPANTKYVFITHESGFALMRASELRKQKTVKLSKWAQVSGRVLKTPGYKQSIRFQMSPEPFLTFWYEIKPDAEGKYATALFPGMVYPSRNIQAGRTSVPVPVGKWALKPGETRSFDLEPMNEYDTETVRLRKKQVDAIMNGGPGLTPKESQSVRQREEADWRRRTERQKDETGKNRKPQESEDPPGSEAAMQRQAAQRATETKAVREEMARLKKQVEELVSPADEAKRETQPKSYLFDKNEPVIRRESFEELQAEIELEKQARVQLIQQRNQLQSDLARAKQAAATKSKAFVVTPSLIIHNGTAVSWQQVEEILRSAMNRHTDAAVMVYFSKSTAETRQQRVEKRVADLKAHLEKQTGQQLQFTSGRGGCEHVDKLSDPSSLPGLKGPPKAEIFREFKNSFNVFISIDGQPQPFEGALPKQRFQQALLEIGVWEPAELLVKDYHEKKQGEANPDRVTEEMGQWLKQAEKVYESELALHNQKKAAQQTKSGLLGRVVWTGDVPVLDPWSIKKDAHAFKFPRTVQNGALQVNKTNKGVGGVFVYLDRAPKGYRPPEKEEFKPIEFGIRDKSFAPRYTVLRTSQEVRLFNTIPAAANIHTKPKRNSEWNSVLRAEDESGRSRLRYKTAELEPVRVTSDFHAWMAAYHLPLDHPFGTVTDKDGKFEIRGLPPGEYKFKVWHEATGFLHRELTMVVPDTPDTKPKPYKIAMNVENIPENRGRGFRRPGFRQQIRNRAEQQKLIEDTQTRSMESSAALRRELHASDTARDGAQRLLEHREIVDEASKLRERVNTLLKRLDRNPPITERLISGDDLLANLAQMEARLKDIDDAKARDFLRTVKSMRLRARAANPSRTLGRVVWEGPVPKLPNINVARDQSVFGETVPNSSLRVEPFSAGVADVFVYLAEKPEDYTPNPEEKLKPVDFAATKSGFTPRSLVVRTQQQVRFINMTRTAINFHSMSFKNSEYNMLVKRLDNSGSASTIYKMSEKIPVKVRSDMQPWINGHHLPLDHPFGTATDTDGRFLIPGLPPGEHTLKVWHELIGWLPDITVTIPTDRVSSRKLFKIKMSAEMVIKAWKESLKNRQERYGARHPSVLQLQRRIAEWEKLLQDEVREEATEKAAA